MDKVTHEYNFTNFSSYIDYCKRKNADATSPATLTAFNNESNTAFNFYFCYKTDNGTYFDTGLIARKTDVATVLSRLQVHFTCTLIGII